MLTTYCQKIKILPKLFNLLKFTVNKLSKLI